MHASSDLTIRDKVQLGGTVLAVLCLSAASSVFAESTDIAGRKRCFVAGIETYKEEPVYRDRASGTRRVQVPGAKGERCFWEPLDSRAADSAAPMPSASRSAAPAAPRRPMAAPTASPADQAQLAGSGLVADTPSTQPPAAQSQPPATRPQPEETPALPAQPPLRRSSRPQPQPAEPPPPAAPGPPTQAAPPQPAPPPQPLTAQPASAPPARIAPDPTPQPTRRPPAAAQPQPTQLPLRTQSEPRFQPARQLPLRTRPVARATPPQTAQQPPRQPAAQPVKEPERAPAEPAPPRRAPSSAPPAAAPAPPPLVHPSMRPASKMAFEAKTNPSMALKTGEQKPGGKRKAQGPNIRTRPVRRAAANPGLPNEPEPTSTAAPAGAPQPLAPPPPTRPREATKGRASVSPMPQPDPRPVQPAPNELPPFAALPEATNPAAVSNAWKPSTALGGKQPADPARSAAAITTRPVPLAEAAEDSRPFQNWQPPGTTASSAAPAPSAAKPKSELPAARPNTKPSADGRFVQLGSVGSYQKAKQFWTSVTGRYPAELEGFEPNIVEAQIEGRGTFFRVRVGPMSASDANDLCKRLDGNCLVVRE